MITGTPPLDALLGDIRACALCAGHLPLGPRPVVRGRTSARLLIIGQAPGTRVHATGLSFDDRSGDRLRDWLGIGGDAFYDEARVAIVPMGFCYPGRDPRTGGDAPPRPECAPLWHPRLLPLLPEVRLTLLVGSYALARYLPGARRAGMTKTVRRWREAPPGLFPLPHPSWRTTGWERRNPWFTAETLPDLRRRTAVALAAGHAA